MYTYEEIKSELLHEINQLLILEPKWNKCTKCPHSGFCCIGADISLYEYEWNKIQDYLLANPEVLAQVKKNFELHSQCYFRVSDRCLIHEIRPLNCIFTPYQAVCGSDGLIHYSIIKGNCKYKPNTIPGNNFDLSKTFIKLPTGRFSSTYYLLLNQWYWNYEMNSSVYGTLKNLSYLLDSFLSQH